MPSVFEEHRNIIASKTGEYQDALLARIEKFQQDLQLYWKYSNEMQYWGNVEEIFRYQKKATRLEARLINAMEIIDEFNEEENMFGWELSQYPLRKKVQEENFFSFKSSLKDIFIRKDFYLKFRLRTSLGPTKNFMTQLVIF